LVIESERAFLAMGNVQLSIQKAEEKSQMFKRSVYVVKDIKQGENFTKENIRVIRPGDGIQPKFFEQILGRKASQNISRGIPLKWELVG